MEWHKFEDKRPTTSDPVVVRCKGYAPTIASYIENPSCNCGTSCCRVWVKYDGKYVARLLNSTVDIWAELPPLPR
jgi:hypothetical protein